MAFSTTTNPLGTWLNRLVPSLPGITEESIIEELKHVISDFSREGAPWQEVLKDIDVISGDPIVQLNPIDGERKVLSVLDVWFDGQLMTPVSANTPDTGTSPSAPFMYTCEGDPSTLILKPTPNADYPAALQVLAILEPVNSEQCLPTLYATQHFEAVYNGVMAYFTLQPNSPVYDTKQAIYYAKKYRQRTKRAWSIANRGYTQGATRWAFPFFGR